MVHTLRCKCWGSTGYCWCVDSNGVEIPGTALGPGQGTPNCSGSGDSLSVLFVGNSYTSFNNLPNLISSIASTMGDVFNCRWKFDWWGNVTKSLPK